MFAAKYQQRVGECLAHQLGQFPGEGPERTEHAGDSDDLRCAWNPGDDVFQLEALHQKVRAAGVAMNVIQGFARAVDNMAIETGLAHGGRDIRQSQWRVGDVHLQARETFQSRRIDQGQHCVGIHLSAVQDSSYSVYKITAISVQMKPLIRR